ncbi:CPBP family intramembrane glutamic endopeptidase [Leucobacter musarum]|uniref:CPBP family intramembrane glutamic endopeptidase n=1 Tax=Leucobacter musarum TaxID=1930747 RepID=UPI000949865D|nr:CPBP family intramembrane glutamic endopeptidase [Leucobacter musarum]
MTDPLAHRPDRFARVPWGALALFVVVSFGLAWLVALPLWVKDASEPGYALLFTALAAAMMFTPTIGALAAVFIARAPRGERLRLLGIWPLRPAKRVVWFVVAALFAPPVITLATIGVAALFGWVRLDLVHYSGYAELLDQQLASVSPDTAEIARQSLPPIGLLVWLQIITIPLLAPINAVFALGEELGWRGWLLPALRPLGTWPALAVSGALWGLWHSPVILLGYNFGLLDWRGVALMVIGCVFWGALLGWTRLRTGSVWPAVFGHAALNASAGMAAMLAAAGAPVDPVLVMPLGVAGWLVLAVILLVLVLTGQFGQDRQPELAPKRPKAVWQPTQPEAMPETTTPTRGA